MSEQELIQALQALIARHAPPVEARRLSVEIVVRDRWRIGLLAGLIALLWVGGLAGVLYMIFWFNRFIVAYSTKAELEGARSWFVSREFHAKMELHHSLEACMAAVPALLLAALGTVWLVLSSRRATLNQINLSLREISEELRQMRKTARAPEGG